MKKSPTLLSILTGVIALALAGAGQYFLGLDEIRYAVILYGVAALLFIIACRHLPEARLTPEISLPRKLGRRNWWCILLALLGLGLGAYDLWQFNIEKPSDMDWWLLTASVSIIVLAGYLSDWFTSQNEPEENIKNRLGKVSDLSWILLIGIFAIGVFMRLYKFDTIPFGVWYDEATHGLESLRLMNEPDFRFVYTEGLYATVHHLALIVLSYKILGVSIYAVRAVSVLIGLGIVVAGFLSGREMFGTAMGLVLAFLLAVSHWTVNFSRIGMHNIPTPFFELVAIYFILRGLRRSSHGDLAMAGLSIGLGLSFYSAYQLFTAMLALFFLLLCLREWRFLKNVWTGLAIMAVTAILTIGPVARFTYENPDKYFGRVQKTSLLQNTPPDQHVEALMRTTRKHLLMFNYQGDPNGRHNLPGEPMLDPFTGALAVIGLAFALWRIRYMRMLLLPLWLSMTLLGGILSLDFEAPQSLRAIGSLPVAYILAVLPLHALWQRWQQYLQNRETSWHYATHALTLPILILLGAIGYSNYHTYFERQAKNFAVWNAFSTPETLTASLLANSDSETEVYVTSYFQSHPTIRFLEKVHGEKFVYKSIATTDRLPLNWTPGKSVSLIVDSRGRSIFDEAAYFYPDAYLQELKSPFGGPTVVSHAKLSADDIASVQGLNVAYYTNADWSGEPIQTDKDALIDFDWSNGLPLEPPFSIEWSGVLKARTYGPHRFAVQGPGSSQLYIGEEPILQAANSSSETFILAQGNHDIRLRTSITNTDKLGAFQFLWHPPDSGVEVVPNHALYVEPMTGNGLLGNYYANEEWEGTPILQRIDPQLNIYFHLTPLPRPYTVRWEGKIAAPVTGTYKFGLESIDESELWINGELLIRAERPNDLVNADIALTAGLHDIEILFADSTDHTHINFYWMPPGPGHQRKVPPDVLFPPRSNYERIDLPTASILGLTLRDPNAPVDSELYRPVEIEVLVTGLNTPKGIAVGPDGIIYVADTGNQQLLLFSPDGEQIAVISEGSAPFEEPFDLAIDISNDPLGELIVTDSRRLALDIFDAQGTYLSTVPADAALLNSSRGLDVDGQGRIWIAATTANRAVALDREGDRLAEYVVGQDKTTQPVDVLIGEDGTLFVAEAQQNTLVHFGPDGRLLRTLDLPKASSIESTHMALVPAIVSDDSELAAEAESDEETPPRGYLYITEPEKGQIAIHDRLGEQVGVFELLFTDDGVQRKPVGIAVDGSGRILVTDSPNGEVLRLTPIE